jgi:putative ABC transport system permease protein
MLVLAWRNIFRNRRRTLITIVMVAFGLAAVLALWAVFDGNNRQVSQSAVSHFTGHLRLSSTASSDAGPMGPTFSPAHAAQLLSREPEVLAYAPRVEGLALVSVGDETRPIAITGIDPTAEPHVTEWAKDVVSGRYLAPGDGNVILLSRPLAEQLGARVGGEAVLVVEAADGSTGAGKFTILGLFDSHDREVDASACLIPLRAAQDLFSLDDAITSFAVTLRHPDRLQKTASRLQTAAGAGYRIQTWKELFPAIAQAVAFHEAFTRIVLGIVLVLLASGVANTMLVAALERRREWGVLLALGAAPRRLFALVLTEGFLLGAIAVPLGIVLGLIPVAYLSRVGLNLAMFEKGLEAMAGHVVVVYPTLGWNAIAMAGLLSLVVVIAATLQPAMQTAQLAPVAAIRNLTTEISASGSHQRMVPSGKWMFWSIALRNAARNRRRSLLVASASAVGIASMILINGLIDGFVYQITDNSTSLLTGHLQIGKPGFYNREATTAQMMERTAPLDQALDAVSGSSVAFARRIQVTAVLSSAGGSSAIQLLGVDPPAERSVTRLLNNVRTGNALAAGDEGGIVLGTDLAKDLHVSTGGKVVVTVQDAHGDLAGAAYRVRGLIETGSKAFDSSLALISLAAAQRQLAVGQRFSVLAVRLTDERKTEEAARELNQRLAGAGLEAATWRTLLPQSDEILEVSHAAFAVILAIALGVTTLGGMNSVLMAVGERRREIGMLLAIGTTPGRLLRMILYESSAVACLGLLVGTLSGALLTLLLGWRGIELGAFAQAVSHLPGMTSVLHPRLIVSHFVGSGGWLIVLNAIACLYPAWLAARLDPVSNLRVSQ